MISLMWYAVIINYYFGKKLFSNKERKGGGVGVNNCFKSLILPGFATATSIRTKRKDKSWNYIQCSVVTKHLFEKGLEKMSFLLFKAKWYMEDMYIISNFTQFNCYLAVPQPTLSCYRGGSLHPNDVNHCVSGSLRSPGAS